MVTRSQSSIVKPLEHFSLHATSISPIPKTPFVALQNSHWRQSMLDEYNALIKNGTWILVPKPVGVNMVHYMWLFKHKFHANGTLSRYKARLIANGSSQQQGIDRSLYGLKQAPHAWFQHFAALLQQIITSLHQEFDMTDLGALNYFLGISATRSSTGLFLSQKKYACELLERANMVNYNPSQTPIDTDSKLGPEGVAVQDPTLYRSDNLLSWSSKRQHTISRSSAEAEYRGVANVVVETAWLRNLLRELHSPLSTTTLVYCDNVSVVYLSTNPVQHQRTKHIKIDIHFVRDMVQTGHIWVLHVPSRYHYADIFTKGLLTALFEDFCSSLSVQLPPAQTAGAY
uniref:Ribonuclease H-like domain-containing protein n=1 Tax=Tanacetum cinerariifolium TaxID=118510 RepID=A0A6L2LXW8_TANCI|nr:ribonuclease H-like domain-containing protein [Tanacetum cinerariifolium]